ncbi:hypothetical protein [Elongatibacter sediminis]|uniref:SGNH hydrolase-type esterase domain-containing protein n=1 Tax=Elongatibacter sediminis TaxID=3119006 RepID=A0AAW9RGX3_9GAMM
MPTLSSHYQRRIERFVRIQRRSKPNAVRVLAEGDSWFTHGHLMWSSKSLIGKLNDYATVNIVTVANPGAELEEMVSARNRDWGLGTNPDWLGREQYDVVLFSGGGNDIVGSELKRYLHPGGGTREGIQLVNRTALNRTLDRMRNQYRTLRGTVDHFVGAAGRSVPIITHGYDYAFPSGEGLSLIGGLITAGPWILPSFKKKEIDDLDDQVLIVNFLVDQFNEMLADLASDDAAGIQDFHHMDLRGTLAREDWADELHPTSGGRDKLAAVIRRQIVTNV